MSSEILGSGRFGTKEGVNSDKTAAVFLGKGSQGKRHRKTP
jgi:hypothetical protein